MRPCKVKLFSYIKATDPIDQRATVGEFNWATNFGAKNANGEPDLYCPKCSIARKLCSTRRDRSAYGLSLQR
jgi:hypothetical protein